MNHRIFERTLRPLVFRRACLFERHFNPQAWLGDGALLLTQEAGPEIQWRARQDPERSS